jgi:hypothetical protein
VHSARLECLGEGLAVCFGEMVGAYWVEMFAVEISAFGNSDVVPKSSDAASRMEDTVHASVGELYLGS